MCCVLRICCSFFSEDICGIFTVENDIDRASIQLLLLHSISWNMCIYEIAVKCTVRQCVLLSTYVYVVCYDYDYSCIILGHLSKITVQPLSLSLHLLHYTLL